MKNKSYRIVVCVDVDADDLEDAYRQTYRYMSNMPDGMDWESSDEWFDGDEDGAGDPNELQAVRMKVYDGGAEEKASTMEEAVLRLPVSVDTSQVDIGRLIDMVETSGIGSSLTTLQDYVGDGEAIQFGAFSVEDKP